MYCHIVPFVGLSLCIFKFLSEWSTRNLDSEINCMLSISLDGRQGGKVTFSKYMTNTGGQTKDGTG